MNEYECADIQEVAYLTLYVIYDCPLFVPDNLTLIWCDMDIFG